MDKRTENLTLLNLPLTATDEEIKIKYKQLAMKHHPDRGGSAVMFTVLNKAYKALMKKPCTTCEGTGFYKKREGAFTKKKKCEKCWRA